MPRMQIPPSMSRKLLPAAFHKAYNELTEAISLTPSSSSSPSHSLLDLSLTVLTTVNSLTDRALDREIRRQLENLLGPNWNWNCIVGYWMIEIIRKPIIELIEKGQAREMNIVGRLRTRVCSSEGGDGKEEEEEEVCSICLEGKGGGVVATLDCRHEYHVECLKEWLLRRKNFCPLCKAMALEVDSDEDVDDGFHRDVGRLDGDR